MDWQPCGPALYSQNLLLLQRKHAGDFPGGPGTQLCAPNAGAWVQSLVREPYPTCHNQGSMLSNRFFFFFKKENVLDQILSLELGPINSGWGGVVANSITLRSPGVSLGQVLLIMPSGNKTNTKKQKTPVKHQSATLVNFLLFEKTRGSSLSFSAFIS